MGPALLLSLLPLVSFFLLTEAGERRRRAVPVMARAAPAVPGGAGTTGGRVTERCSLLEQQQALAMLGVTVAGGVRGQWQRLTLGHAARGTPATRGGIGEGHPGMGRTWVR